MRTLGLEDFSRDAPQTKPNAPEYVEGFCAIWVGRGQAVMSSVEATFL